MCLRHHCHGHPLADGGHPHPRDVAVPRVSFPNGGSYARAGSQLGVFFGKCREYSVQVSVIQQVAMA